MQEKITASTVGKLPTGTYSDPQLQGLRIRVRDGRAAFELRYTFAGRRSSLTIGATPTMGLREARVTAQMLKDCVARGLDPAERFRSLSDRAETGQRERAKTFGEILEPALADIIMVKRWKSPQSEAAWRHTLRDFAGPVLGDIPLDEIGREDVLRVLRPIWETKTETAVRLCGRLETVFNWCKAKGYMTVENPARWHGNISLFLPPPSRVREVVSHAAAPVDAVPDVFAKLWTANGTTGPMAVLFGALTATRVGEFIAARWNEIDRGAMVWTIPAERRKDRKPYPHRVPLNRYTLAVLDRLIRVGDFIFPGSYGEHASIATPLMSLRANGYAFTMHGFRSTFRDWAAIHEKDFVASEKCLMHAVGNKVTAAYLRTDMLETRRPIMLDWAEYCFGKIKLP